MPDDASQTVLPLVRYRGFCPICEAATTFEAYTPHFRDSLICVNCPGWSFPRERAVALVLHETRPNWRELAVHESSPAERGISLKLRAQGQHYVASHFYPNEPDGALVGGFRNINLESQAFADASFDIVITIDVFEHLFDPAAALNEIWRTLRPGGVLISAFPMVLCGHGGETRWRAKRTGSTIEHLLPEEYHINPIDEKGSLVTIDYGYDVHERFAEWAPFDVRVLRFADRNAGILGEFTDVVVCAKR